MRAYLLAAGLTLAVELPLYMVALRLVAGVGFGQIVRLAVLVNLATHPLLWWVLYPAGREVAGPVVVLVCVELWAWWVESFLLWRALRGEALVATAAALLANTASFLVGVLLLW